MGRRTGKGPKIAYDISDAAKELNANMEIINKAVRQRKYIFGAFKFINFCPRPDAIVFYSFYIEG
jgi:hypothetical protein